jgi:hypothetical protein
MKRNFRLLATKGLAFGAAAAAPAIAQAASADANAPGDIVVTARCIEERLQDVPISITVYNQQQIAIATSSLPVTLRLIRRLSRSTSAMGRENHRSPSAASIRKSAPRRRCPTGMIQGRWTDCSAQPIPGIRKVATAEVTTLLPAGTQMATPQERGAIIREWRCKLQQRPLW